MNALGMKNTTIAALFACIVIIALTSMGGLMAVTVTDGFQINIECKDLLIARNVSGL